MTVSTDGAVALVVRFSGSYSHLLAFGYRRFAPHYSLVPRAIDLVEITEASDGVVILILGKDLGFYLGDAGVKALVEEFLVIEALRDFATRLLRGRGGRSRSFRSFHGLPFCR